MSQKQLTNIFKPFTRGLSYSLGCPAVFSIAFCGVLWCSAVSCGVLRFSGIPANLRTSCPAQLFKCDCISNSNEFLIYNTRYCATRQSNVRHQIFTIRYVRQRHSTTAQFLSYGTVIAECLRLAFILCF